jgi:hypothetical protein
VQARPRPAVARTTAPLRAHCLQGLVNWKKRQMLSDVIESIALMQQMQCACPACRPRSA